MADDKYIVQYNLGEDTSGADLWHDSSPREDFAFDISNSAAEQRAWQAAKAYLIYEEGQEEDDEFKFAYRIVRRTTLDVVEEHRG